MADFTAEEILNDLNQGAYDDETAELAQRAIAQGDEDVLDTLLAPGLTRGAMTSFGLGDDDVSAIASTLYMDPSAPFPDPDPVDCSNLDLYTEKHSVHMVIGEGDAKEYVVSNIRDFSITVMLQDRFTQGLSNYELRLKASVLYENSMPVRASPGESTLLGPKQSTNTEVTIKGGRATFTLRMGVGTLSKKHDNQRFRIKIEPVDEQLSTAYPTLTQLTEPLKSVTKLQRSTPHAANSTPAARASQQQQQQQQGFGAIPNYGDALPLPLPMPSSGIPAPAAGAASSAGAASTARAPPAAAGGSTGSSSLQSGLRAIPQGLGLGSIFAPSGMGAPAAGTLRGRAPPVAALGSSTTSEGAPRPPNTILTAGQPAAGAGMGSMEQVLASQRQQIELLEKHNGMIMKELERLKAQQPAEKGPPS